VHRLSAKVVIVTGAAQGIGAAYALALADEGAKIAVTDVADCAETVAGIRARGAAAFAMTADVTDEDRITDFIAAVVREFGTVDVLVNNAAIFTSLERTPFENISVDDWDRVVSTNTRGPFVCAKAVLPAMRAGGGGKIVNIASSTVFTGQPMFLHYVASKGAVVAMTRAIARELGGDNICVNCIAPGLTMSEGVVRSYGSASTQPVLAARAIKRLQNPDDLLGTLVFLASSDSDFITGQVIVVDGGGFMN
jgi:NAD(P)-dependent dehydrogenase (short-subunit alcohol dehydrogenase family)